MTIRNFLFKSLILWLLFPAIPRAQDGGDIVQKLQAKYEKIQSFSAHFQQVFHSRHSRREEFGVVMMKKPGRMHWEYQHPTQKFFIWSGEKAYFYLPKDKQVMVSEVKSNVASTPLLFLLGKGNIQQDFRIELETQEKALESPNLILRLIPREPQGEFSYLILELVPSSYVIYRLSVIDPIGNRNDYVFTKFRENVRISDRRFQFKVPRGVEVITAGY